MFLEAPRSEPRPTMYRPPTDDDSPCDTPIYRRGCHTARAPTVAPALSVPTGHHGGFQVLYAPMMHQLDPNGYPTRALYYLHKRMLDIAIHPGLYQQRTRPGTPIVSPLFTPLACLEEEEQDEDGMILNLSIEGDQALHDLCATLVSADYVAPPTPPSGASPCATPPRFESPVKNGHKHDEHACRIARMVVSYGVMDIEPEVLEEMQVELECGLGGMSPLSACGKGWSCPSSTKVDDNALEPERNSKSLFEEMQLDGVETPCVKKGFEDRKVKQARRRARNSLNGLQGMQPIVV